MKTCLSKWLHPFVSPPVMYKDGNCSMSLPTINILNGHGMVSQWRCFHELETSAFDLCFNLNVWMSVWDCLTPSLYRKKKYLAVLAGVLFWRGNRGVVELGERSGGGELRGVEGGETVSKCIVWQNNLFNIKEKKGTWASSPDHIFIMSLASEWWYTENRSIWGLSSTCDIKV